MHLLRRLGNRYEPPMHLVLRLRKIASNNTGIIRERHGERSTTPFGSAPITAIVRSRAATARSISWLDENRSEWTLTMYGSPKAQTLADGCSCRLYQPNPEEGTPAHSLRGAYLPPVCFVCAPSAPLCLCCRRVMRAQVRFRSSRTAMCNVPQPSQVSSMLSPSMNGLSPRWLVPVARMSPGCSV